MSEVDDPEADPSDLSDEQIQWSRDLAWLADADRDRLEERVDRLAGDKDLEAALRVTGFTGRDYVLFANEIVRYGVAVIRG